jgi:hypothetical protein
MSETPQPEASGQALVERLTRYRCHVQRKNNHPLGEIQYVAMPPDAEGGWVRWQDVEAAAAALSTASPAPAIDCPLCGVRVEQVASATLSLALSQHVHWVCAKQPASPPGERPRCNLLHTHCWAPPGERPDRRVPDAFSTGADRHNAQKAWLDGYDTAKRGRDGE